MEFVIFMFGMSCGAGAVVTALVVMYLKTLYGDGSGST